MCLILFALEARPDLPFVLAANRDEFYARSASPLAEWPSDPRAPDDNVVAGKDLEAGGTWLGLTKRLRLAALTNVRKVPFVKGPRSRGDLVVEALDRRASIEAHLRRAFDARAEYAPFNLLAVDLANGAETGTGAWVSDELGVHRVAAGLHGLSNATLDVPWPKVTRGVTALERALAEAAVDRERLFSILQDRTIAPDAELPHTGVPFEIERALSPGFLAGVPGLQSYGTRCSTVVLGYRDRVEIEERTFDERGEVVGAVRETLALADAGI